MFRLLGLSGLRSLRALGNGSQCSAMARHGIVVHGMSRRCLTGLCKGEIEMSVSRTIARLIACIAMLPVNGAALAQNECFSRCESNYYLCLRGGASVGERGCSAIRSTCNMSCTQGGGSFGAIAYSKVTRTYGFASQYESRERAERRAVQECAQSRSNATDCAVLVWFNNRCGALALGDDGGYGAAQDQTRQAASAKAMANCQPHAATCRIVRVVCGME